MASDAMILEALPAAAAIVKARHEGRVKTPRFQILPLYPKQAAIVDDPHRFTVTEATSKAGKTMSHLEWLLSEAASIREGNFWWVATVSRTARVAFERAQDRLRGFIQKPDGDGFRKVQVADPIPFTSRQSPDMEIELFGARVSFLGAEKSDNLYGDDVRRMVGDEYTRWRQEAWTACYTTLAATKGRAKLIGNVKGRRNWGWKQARKAEAGESDWGFHRLTAYDAADGGILDPDIIEQAQRDLPESVFKELFLAEAASDEGNPFGGSEAIGACVGLRSESPAVVYGVDLAKSVDWTWVIGLDAAGRWTLSERWQSPWGETIDRINRITRGAPIVVDSTGVGDAPTEELQRGRGATTGFKFSSSSKQQIMERLAVVIQRREITIPAGALVAELESYEYQYTRTGVRYDCPSGMHDDGVCALALAVHGMVGQVMPITPASFAFPSRIKIEAAPWD